LKLASGSQSTLLAHKIAHELGVNVANINLDQFPTGEIKVETSERFIDEEVCVLQATAPDVNSAFMEVFFLCEAIRQANARSITVIFTYLSYMRQDKSQFIPLTCIARILHDLGVTRIATIDMHSIKTRDFLGMEADSISATDVFASYIRSQGLDDVCIVSPDLGGKARAIELSQALQVPYACIDKRRHADGSITAIAIEGEVEGKVCYLIDDVIDTGATILAAAELLSQKKVRAIHACSSHAVFTRSEQIIEQLEQSKLESITVTDTIDAVLSLRSSKIQVLPMASVIANYIKQCL
jgi:ribose-phosphate pyrophosphokinase